MTVLLSDPGSGTSLSDNLNTVLVVLGVFAVVGPVVYYVSRSIRRRQGLDLERVYAEVPPE